MKSALSTETAEDDGEGSLTTCSVIPTRPGPKFIAQELLVAASLTEGEGGDAIGTGVHAGEYHIEVHIVEINHKKGSPVRRFGTLHSNQSNIGYQPSIPRP